MSIVIDGRRRPLRQGMHGQRPETDPGEPRLLVLSNRLPVRVERQAGDVELHPADGGLVTALGPLVRDRGGLWIGWPGIADDAEDRVSLEHSPALKRFGKSEGFTVRPVPLLKRDIEDYYSGFCNRTLWPLFHGFAPSGPVPDRHWRAYQRVNERFADVVREEVLPSDHILVNDYHLLLVPGLLRAHGVENPIACFIHTPFPPGELFSRLPWAHVIEESLLQADRLGFQTPRDHRNFVSTVGKRSTLRHESGAFPISVDVDEFTSMARRQDVRARADTIREEIGVPHLILGVDRLDYTKGILEKLAGFEALLEEREDLIGQVCLTQLVIPSRTSVPEYRDLRDRIERKVARINGRYSTRGWIPIHYQFSRWARDELVAQYLAADVGLVTPVRDGMNLVAKEFCVSQPAHRPGMLVLSEFAGAARELTEALIVNPHSAQALADAIRKAIEMPRPERRKRMSAMIRTVREADVYQWARTLLAPNPASLRKDLPGDGVPERAMHRDAS